MLLADSVLTYLPFVGDYFGPESLISSTRFWNGPEAAAASWKWSLLRGVSSVGLATSLTIAWAVSALTLLLGYWSRSSALTARLLSTSYFTLHADLHDGGDRARILALFYLMLSPCGAVWSLDRWRREIGSREKRRVYIPPWPLRLLCVQLAVMYFFGGIEKLSHEGWRDGTVLQSILSDLNWSLSSYPSTLFPAELVRFLGIAVATWEVGFPVLILFPLTRPVALLIGILFHLSLLATVRIGLFPLYMLCFYLPFFPWEHMSSLRHWRPNDQSDARRVEQAANTNNQSSG